MNTKTQTIKTSCDTAFSATCAACKKCLATNDAQFDSCAERSSKRSSRSSALLIDFEKLLRAKKYTRKVIMQRLLAMHSELAASTVKTLVYDARNITHSRLRDASNQVIVATIDKASNIMSL